MNVYEVEELAWICAEDEQQAERVAQLEIDDFNIKESPITLLEDKKLDELFVYLPEDQDFVPDDTPKETFREAIIGLSKPQVIAWSMVNM